jgi:hypothetical protein
MQGALLAAPCEKLVNPVACACAPLWHLQEAPLQKYKSF